jgi:hypothetical protein
VLAAVLAIGCASQFPTIGKTFDFFAPPRPDDPFYSKVLDWQRRAQSEDAPDAVALPVPTPADDPDAYPFGVLRDKFDRFLIGHKRALAREFTVWSQRQARLHFKLDPDTTLTDDHWPTLGEFFATNGDDCDGLDLIAYGLLREAGFRADEIYRMVVRRERDGANHMVTLWFEDRADPWVIDATGAMTYEMRKASKLPPGWLPRVMFNENEVYSVREEGPNRFELARDRDANTEVAR